MRTFNEHFINITKILDLKTSVISTTTSLPNLLKLLKIIPALRIFFLQKEGCQFNEVRKVILNMNEKKANLTGDILVRILKDCLDSNTSILTKILHNSLERGCFQNQPELTEVTPVFKKKDELIKENYRPVRVFSNKSRYLKEYSSTKGIFFSSPRFRNF